MSYTKTIKDIQSGKIDNVYFFYGEEPFFIDKMMSALEDNVLQEHEKSFNQMALYGKEVDGKQVLDNLRRFPMMAQRQLVLLREGQSFKGWDMLQSYFERPNPTTVFGIAFKAKSPDKRKKWVKALFKSKHVKAVESKTVYESKIPEWVDKYLSEKGFSISPQASRLMSIYLGNKLSQVANELDKLMILQGKNKKITLDEVEKNIGISKLYNVFELQIALGERNISKSNFIVHNLKGQLQKQPIQFLMPSLHGFFQKVYALKSIQGGSNQEIARALNIYSEYFVKDYKAASKHYSTPQLEKIFSLFNTYDTRSKGIDGSRQKDGAILMELVQQILYC